LAWLDVLRQTSGGNSLPDYLSATAHFQAGDQSAAVQNLIAASGKAGFGDFSRDRIQGNEEAYLGRLHDRRREIVLKYRSSGAALGAVKGIGSGRARPGKQLPASRRFKLA
jgi:hypothetical protein